MLDPAPPTDLAALGHELYTAVNQILGHTGMLIEEAKEHGLAEIVAPLQEIHRGGWKVLERIDAGLAGAGQDESRQRLTALGHDLRGPSEDLLKKSEHLALHLRSSGRAELLVEADLITQAVQRLLAVPHNFQGKGAHG